MFQQPLKNSIVKGEKTLFFFLVFSNEAILKSFWNFNASNHLSSERFYFFHITRFEAFEFTEVTFELLDVS